MTQGGLAGRATRHRPPDADAPADATGHPDGHHRDRQPDPRIRPAAGRRPTGRARPGGQGPRAGRTRAAAADIVWFDTADGTLAAKGLVVEAPRRGARLLVRCLPDDKAPWHPGQPPEVVRHLEAEEKPDVAGGDPLVAVVAFTGRRQALRLALPSGAVEAVLLEGRLRCVAAEMPMARLSLSGPLPAVIALAQALASEIPLLPPLCALAESGRALATGTSPRPHRLGPPNTAAATTAEDAFMRAVGHLLEVARQQSARIAHGGGPEGVHQARVALRRLRSAAAGVPHGDRLRRAARARCAVPGRADGPRSRAGLGCVPRRHRPATSPPPSPGNGASRRCCARRRRSGTRPMTRCSRCWRRLAGGGCSSMPSASCCAGPGAREQARKWRRRSKRRCAPSAATSSSAAGTGCAAPARPSRRSRPRSCTSCGSTESALRYAAEVFAPVFGAKSGRRFLRRLASLQDGLGIANDAAVARGLARSLAAPGQGGRAWAVGVVEGWCEARVAGHRGDAFEAWERLSGKDRFWSGD